MKKIIAVNVVIGMLITFSVLASVASDTVVQPDQSQPITTGEAVISGENDTRVITPEMNYYERVMIQRDIKKRAAAKRNQLMQQARQHQEQPAQTGYPNLQ